MATKKKTAAARPEFPKNIAVAGVLSFPLLNENHLHLLKEWRADKGYSKPKFPDRLGGTLFLKQNAVDKVQKYLLEEFLPFTAELHAFDDGKGFDEETIEGITAKVTNGDWSLEDYNLPLRNLSEKDVENLNDTDYVAKLSFSASGGNDISVRALIRDEDGSLMVTDIDDVNGVPSNMEETLFWGARNTFRAAFNFNAYVAAASGVSAYTRTLYLRTDLPMTWGGEDESEAILEDDFED